MLNVTEEETTTLREIMTTVQRCRETKHSDMQ